MGSKEEEGSEEGEQKGVTPTEEFWLELEQLGPGGQFEDSPMIDSGLRVSLYGDPPRRGALTILDNPADMAKVRKMIAGRSTARRWKPKRRGVNAQDADRG